MCFGTGFFQVILIMNSKPQSAFTFVSILKKE